jgi:streptogramin lyase
MRVALLLILAAALVGTAAGAHQLAPARIAARIVTGNGPCSEGSGFGALWVSNIRDATVARIDPATKHDRGEEPSPTARSGSRPAPAPRSFASTRAR